MNEGFARRDDLDTVLARLKHATARMATGTGPIGGDADQLQLARGMLADLSAAVVYLRRELAGRGGLFSSVLAETAALRADVDSDAGVPGATDASPEAEALCTEPAAEHVARHAPVGQSGESLTQRSLIRAEADGVTPANVEVEALRAELATAQESRRALESRLEE